MTKSVQVLVSTMNLGNVETLLRAMRLNTASIVINQITNSADSVPSGEGESNCKLLNYHEQGLSRSRNRGIAASEADICVIADDDMYYEQNFEDIIKNAYEECPEADVIAFHVDSKDPRQRKRVLKKGRLSRITSMKIASWQITFRQDSLRKTGVKFDESFGTGATNFMGEENIFLYDCIRNRLKVYYYPAKIATLKDEDDSTWFTGYTERYFMVKGAVFKRMSRYLWPLFIVQFVIRKHHVYGDSLSAQKALISMFKGARG